MHLVLTDVLSCPRCGPEHGLIVLSDEMADRRILEGRLGCPNCETDYPIHAGLVDLRVDGTTRTTVTSDATNAFELVALMGVTAGPGFALLLGASAAFASAAARIVPGLEWVVIGADVEQSEEQSGVNRILLDARAQLPLTRMRGAIAFSPTPEEIPELARVLGPGARLVITGVTDALAQNVTAAGLRVLARSTDTLVAS